MMTIEPAARLRGEITVPGDKSISHRAVMCGAIARGVTRVTGVLACDDCDHTIAAFRAMGVRITQEGPATHIDGGGLRGLVAPSGPLAAGESGTTMRILPGILAGQSFETTLDCAPSLARRPMKRVIEPFSHMGVEIRSRGGYPPLAVRGGAVRPIDYTLPVPSAQVKSAILFAGLYADGVTTVREAFVSRDHTERMLAYFGAEVVRDGTAVSVRGGPALTAREFSIPGDISSAAFFLAGAALLPDSRILVRNVSTNPTRAGIIDVLTRMGAAVRPSGVSDIFEPYADLVVSSSALRGITIEEAEVPRLIDELPAICVLAACAKGKTVIKGAGELRVKETDRIASMQANLRAMGAHFDVTDDTIIIEGVRRLSGAELKSYGDHRTCMAMTIAALAASGSSRIDDVACVSKSLPGFFTLIDKVIQKR